MNFPENLFYTKEHEWVDLQGEYGVIGITEFAQSELGDIVFVELPKVGSKIFIDKTFGTIEAVKAVSDLFAPLSGEVVEVNPGISTNPEFVNKEPYGNGWMLKIKIENKVEAEKLLNVNDYKKLIGI